MKLLRVVSVLLLAVLCLAEIVIIPEEECGVLVFATSLHYGRERGADFGSLDNADAHCEFEVQTAAQMSPPNLIARRAQNGSQFRAWLSIYGGGENATNAADRLYFPSDSHFCLLNQWGQTVSVANGSAFLRGGSGRFRVSLRVTAWGDNLDDKPPHQVWTATNTLGLARAGDCDGWTNKSGTLGSLPGDLRRSDGKWTGETSDYGDFYLSCDEPARLYCFEVPPGVPLGNPSTTQTPSTTTTTMTTTDGTQASSSMSMSTTSMPETTSSPTMTTSQAPTLKPTRPPAFAGFSATTTVMMATITTHIEMEDAGVSPLIGITITIVLACVLVVFAYCMYELHMHRKKGENVDMNTMTSSSSSSSKRRSIGGVSLSTMQFTTVSSYSNVSHATKTSGGSTTEFGKGGKLSKRSSRRSVGLQQRSKRGSRRHSSLGPSPLYGHVLYDFPPPPVSE